MGAWLNMFAVIALLGVSIFMTIDVVCVTVKNIVSENGNGKAFRGLLIQVILIGIASSLGLYLIGVRF